MRGVGLRAAVATNAIAMIGIGPLITIPLILRALHGPLSLVAWIAGALIAACDGLIWAELGAAIPGSGGLYAFVTRLFGGERGRLLAFLYVWQFVLTTPFLLASGYIGFAQYAAYLWPPLREAALGQHLVAAAVGIATMALLARVIQRVAAISIALFCIASLTLFVVAAAAWSRFDVHVAFAGDWNSGFLPALGAGFGTGLILTLYDYLGYNTVTSIGDEVIAPPRTMPRSILLAVALVAAFYLILQTGVLGAIPWQNALDQQYLASLVVERAWGPAPASLATALILITAFASTFALLLAASRVPYAAARDGLFFRSFAHLHGKDAYPDVALFAIGTLSLGACFLPLDQIIAVIGVGIVVLGGIGAFASVLVLRRSDVPMPYRMPLFPLPPLVALAAWGFVVASAGQLANGFTVLSLLAGTLTFRYAVSRTAASAGNETS
ncbi:MAG: APC family permease [Vulcanimicrobiaceae bacterium]